jgi:3-oxoacyl-[acyl-carrier-protein] synthase-3
VLETAGFDSEDVDVVIPHQANGRIVDAATRLLKFDENKVFMNIENLGNTGAASIPMAISDALDSNQISPGDIVVLSAFGGGVTWGSIVLRWGERTERLGLHDGELPSTDATVFELIEPNLRFFAELHGLDPDDPIV